MQSQRIKPDLVIKNCGQLLTMKENAGDRVGLITGGHVAIKEGLIVFVGSQEAYQNNIDDCEANIIDAREKVVLPGFVDCHTHLVFGKSRVDEYVAGLVPGGLEGFRSKGVPTGIEASVHMTRAESEETLYHESLSKVTRMMSYGTTTLEIKSGYGLDRETEMKQLSVIAKLKKNSKTDISATFLGAHGWPKEMTKARYIDFLMQEMIPLVAEGQMAEACDIWVDEGYYTAKEAEKILTTGRSFGLASKIHTDCYSYVGGSDLAAEYRMMSADHLNYIPTHSIKKLAEAKVPGVLLPGTDFSVNHPKPFDPRPMIEGGMILALATNFNPGNWIESLQLIIALACRRHRMRVEEALEATTIGGAKALKKDHLIGSLEVGKLADIQIWNTSNYKDVAYKHGRNFVETVIKKGEVVVERVRESD